jgi:hypothetical protein
MHREYPGVQIMSDLKYRKSEADSACLLDQYRVTGLLDTPPPVQALEDSPASPARSVATLALRDTSPVLVRSGNTEQELARARVARQEWGERWAEGYREETGLTGPHEGAKFVAGDEKWTLWYEGRHVSKKGSSYIVWKLYYRKAKAAKRVWLLGETQSDEGRLVKNKDAELLEMYMPEMHKWVSNAVERGVNAGPLLDPPPGGLMPTRKRLRRIRRKERGELEPREKKLQNERERYSERRVEARKRYTEAANEVSEKDAQTMLVAIHQAWEAKTPFSFWKQAGMERYAPAIFGQVLGLSEMAVSSWITNMIIDGRIAQEIVSTKTKKKGLKVLEKQPQD